MIRPSTPIAGVAFKILQLATILMNTTLVWCLMDLMYDFDVTKNRGFLQINKKMPRIPSTLSQKFPLTYLPLIASVASDTARKTARQRGIYIPPSPNKAQGAMFPGLVRSLAIL